MRVYFLSQEKAESVTPDNNSAMISIVGKDSRPRKLVGWKHELDLHFDDITKPMQGHKLFTKIDAMRIKNFVRSLPRNVNTIYVHCRSGVSRSAAVAKWINDVYRSTNYPTYYYSYNPYVYSVLSGKY